jgi:hypothetical protein
VISTARRIAKRTAKMVVRYMNAHQSSAPGASTNSCAPGSARHPGHSPQDEPGQGVDEPSLRVDALSLQISRSEGMMMWREPVEPSMKMQIEEMSAP